MSLLLTQYIKNHYNNREEISKNDSITVGVSPDYYPFTFMQENTITGFDIDLITIIGKKLNKEINIISLPFHTILPSLQSHIIMLAISGLTGTVERAKNTLISIPYLDINPLCIVSLKENNINHIDQLTNQSVIINQGYATEDFLNSLDKNITIEQFKSMTDALIGLKNKKSIAFVTLYNVIKEIKNSDQGNLYDITIIEGTTEHLSILLNKHETDLLLTINTIITELHNDGTIEALIKKWHIND